MAPSSFAQGSLTEVWEYRGQRRPAFAVEPAEGQESVWDYPRPPSLVPSAERIEVRLDEALLADTNESYRVLETASPPTYYLPSTCVDWNALCEVSQGSFCEWKGRATYYVLASKPEGPTIAWRYRNPSPSFASLHDHVSFYPGRIACFVDGERVRPQAGDFYGGWITNRVVGPFKGEAGTGHW
ncbi:MAG: DUF427 domain-containing protein [Pseudomonadota bacterium]